MNQYRVTFVSPVNFTNGENFVLVSADDREGAQEAAIDSLEARGVCVPSIRKIEKL